MRKKIVILFIMSFIGCLSVGCKADMHVVSEKSKKQTVINQKEKSLQGNAKEENKKENIEEDIKMFSYEDAEAFGIKIDMERKEVEKILGKPKKTESHFEDAFGADVINYFYDFGNIRFEPLNEKEFFVSSIMIDVEDDNFVGPRNIKIGDSIEEVLRKFPYDENAVMGEEQSKIIYGKMGENCGILRHNEKGEITELVYLNGEGGFGSYVLQLEVYNNKIKSINITVINI